MFTQTANQLVLRFIFLIPLFLLNACTTSTYMAYKPRIRTYIPQYIDFTYAIDKKLQIKHSYLFGAGAKKCRYVGQLAKPYMQDGQLIYPYQSVEIDDFFESGGHIYQGGVNSDREVLGYPYTSRLGGDVDPITGKQEIIITKMWNFEPLCHSRIGSSEYTIYLQKSSALSIEKDIAQIRQLLGGAWKRGASWEPESAMQRRNNIWIVFKSWNRADYLSDSDEYWYLSLGDGTYYYKLIFTYKSAMRERNDEQYIEARAMFDHLLDSFEVEKSPSKNPQ